MIARRFYPGDNHGFTLIELLAVSAILAVLMLLVFNASSAIQNRIQAAKCLSNLHSLGAVIASYSADNNGKIPTRNLGLYRETGRPPSTERAWPSRMLNLGYTDNPDIFYCPSFFPRRNADARRNIRAGACETYGMRMWVPPGATSQDPSREEEKPMALIENPSDFFLVADSVWIAEGWKCQGYGLVAGAAEQLIHLRHNGLANALFVDGHAEAKPRSYFERLGDADRQGKYSAGRQFSITDKMEF